MQLHQPEVLEEFARRDARLLVISFASLTRFNRWPEYWRTNFLEPALQEAGKTPPENPFQNTTFLHDPSLKTYQAYGLGRFTVLKAYGPGILVKYAKWGLQGKPIKAPHEDTLQRGGDFVVDRHGIVKFAHTGRDQTDRPSVRQILKHFS